MSEKSLFITNLLVFLRQTISFFLSVNLNSIYLSSFYLKINVIKIQID